MSIATIALTLTLIPLQREILDSLAEKLQIEEGNLTLYDKATNAYNISYSIGGALGPIIGGWINEYFEFAKVCDYMAFCSLGYGILYFFLSILPMLCSKGSPGQPILFS